MKNAYVPNRISKNNKPKPGKTQTRLIDRPDESVDAPDHHAVGEALEALDSDILQLSCKLRALITGLTGLAHMAACADDMDRKVALPAGDEWNQTLYGFNLITEDLIEGMSDVSDRTIEQVHGAMNLVHKAEQGRGSQNDIAREENELALSRDATLLGSRAGELYAAGAKDNSEVQNALRCLARHQQEHARPESLNELAAATNLEKAELRQELRLAHGDVISNASWIIGFVDGALAAFKDVSQSAAS